MKGQREYPTEIVGLQGMLLDIGYADGSRIG